MLLLIRCLLLLQLIVGGGGGSVFWLLLCYSVLCVLLVLQLSWWGRATWFLNFECLPDGPPGYNSWISFTSVFICMYCRVLIFVLFPFNISICMY